MSAFGAGFTGWICARYALDWYILVSSCALQVVSLGLLSTLSTTSTHVKAAEYGHQIMLGLGFGAFNTCIILIARSIVEGRDQAVTIGAITQGRTLDGGMGLAIAQVVLFNKLLRSLKGQIPGQDLRAFFQSVDILDSLPGSKAPLIGHGYAAGFNFQMRTTMYFAIAASAVCFLAWRKDMMTLDQANVAKMNHDASSQITEVAKTDNVHLPGELSTEVPRELDVEQAATRNSMPQP